MFKPTDPTFVAYRELRESFGGNSVVILVYKDPQLATTEGLNRNAAIAQRVNGIPGVGGALSPAKLNRAVQRIQPLTLFSNAPALFREGDPVSEGFNDLFSGYTHSPNHQRAAVVAILEPDHPPETLQTLRNLASGLSTEFTEGGREVISEPVLVGEPVLVSDGFELIERDGARLAAWTVVLLSVVVLFTLADLRFVILMAGVIAWSVIVTRAIMVWMSIELSIVSSILTAIVTVIAVAATLHLGVRFRSFRARGETQSQATKQALAGLMVPIGWTCATDAAGFAALGASQILPIRQFGWMIACASIAVFIAVILFSPAAMMLPGRSRSLAQVTPSFQARLSRRLRRGCLGVASWSIRHRRFCVVFSVFAALVAIIGVSRVKTETSFLNNFRSDSSIVKAYEQVELHLGGAGVWDVIVDAPVELTGDYLDQVRALETKLRAIDVNGARLTKVLSLADAEQVAAQATFSQLASPAARLSFMSLAMPTFYRALITDARDGQRKLRIMLRSRENIPSEQKEELILAVKNVASQHLVSEGWKQSMGDDSQVQVTGYYVIMAQLVGQLVGDQWRCFLASGAFVWALLIFATKSVRLATLALLPNLLPVFLVLALVGLLGGKINMGAAMIAAVSIGLSIDGSVHFLSGFRRSLRRGHTDRAAAIHAAGNVGVPVLFATVALVVGFGVLATSNFIPTATFGLLVAATLAIGTVVNLTLLPALVARDR